MGQLNQIGIWMARQLNWLITSIIIILLINLKCLMCLIPFNILMMLYVFHVLRHWDQAAEDYGGAEYM